MKKKVKQKAPTSIRRNYDFSGGVRGKYSKRYSHNNNIVVIERDIARYFSDSVAVNEALRTLLRLRKSKNIAA